MRAYRNNRYIDADAMGAPLGEAPEPLSRDAIGHLRAWMVNSYGSSREIDYLAAAHGHYHKPIDETLIEAEERALRREAVREAVRELPMLQAGVISKRWGLWNTEPMTLRQLGAALGLSHTMVAKHEARALEQLEAVLAGRFTNCLTVRTRSRTNKLLEAAT